MFENFRERLHMVQQDFTTGFKTLGDKSRDTKIKSRAGFEENLPHFSAGLEILSRYEESWFLLHKRTKDCAQTAEAADGDIVMLSAHWERRRAALTQLQEQLQVLPTFISELDAITASIAHLEGDFEEMESRLVYLETLCSQCDQQTVRQHHINQLELYKKKKRKEMEQLEAELNSEHAQKVAELEQAMQQKLKERQKVYEEAFHQDMEQYRSTGHLQHREPTGADLCVLDQMTVTNTSDQEALDDFLNSTGDDISSGSSLTSGPDFGSCSSESSSQAPPTNNQLSNHNAAWQQEEEVASEESDEPLVQSDEEDVQADMSLVGLGDGGTVRGSDDSDSAGDLPCGSSSGLQGAAERSSQWEEDSRMGLLLPWLHVHLWTSCSIRTSVHGLLWCSIRLQRKQVAAAHLVQQRALSGAEAVNALRPFYFAVHPDFFGQYPREREVNENSLKRLNGYLENLQRPGSRSVQPMKLTFYVRETNSSSDAQPDLLGSGPVDISWKPCEFSLNVRTTVQ